MLGLSGAAAEAVLNDVLHRVELQTHTRRLARHVPEFSQPFILGTTHACIQTANLPAPAPPGSTCTEDVLPLPAKVDQFAVGLLKSVSPGQSSPNVHPLSPHDVLARTGSTFRHHPRVKNSQSISHAGLDYLGSSTAQKNSFYDLSKTLPKAEEQQLQLQFEIESLQKKLQLTRKFLEKEQTSRFHKLETLKNTKPREVPRKHFTFAFEGQLLKQRELGYSKQNVQQMKYPIFNSRISSSLEVIKPPPARRQSFLKLTSVEQRPSVGTRYDRRESFHNGEKRQVSHLPYISLSDNSKIMQNSTNNEGMPSRRLSLKQFNEGTSRRSSFKHFLLLREASQPSTGQNQMQEPAQQTKNPEKLSSYEASISQKSGGYLWGKHRRRNKQFKFDQDPKLFNFSPAGFPKAGSIHDYYKHDFDLGQQGQGSEYRSDSLQPGR